MNFRDHFDFQLGLIHLNNAGVTLLSKPCQEAMVDGVRFWGQMGFHGYELFLARLEKARQTVAQFINVEAKQVAFVANCSTAISLLAFGIPLKPKDEIVISDQEYPSNRYPWHNRAQRDGLKIVEVPSLPNGAIHWDQFMEAIGPRTRVVAISWVQYGSGVQAPLKEISQKAHQYGAYVIVDVIQGLGVLPFDFKAQGVDAICCGTHKWLCGPLGHGFLAISLDLATQVYPVIQGALTFGTPETPFNVHNLPHPSAKRFESGGLNGIAALGLAASMELFLRYGQEKIFTEAMKLRNFLRDELKARGAQIVADGATDEGSPIVTFKPRKSVEEVAQRLMEKKISFSLRLGGIRISPHAYNTMDEINQVLECLEPN